MTPTDEELLASHVAGDPDAFGELFVRHKDRLWAIALRTMRDAEDAADALQDALIAAFRRADSFRGRSAVSTWLHRIVVNSCLDRIRSNRVRRAEPLVEAAAPPLPDPAEEAELSTVVGEALAELNADQRAALVLVDMQGYSVNEAAEILGCAPGTVKSRCARGRARLAEILGWLREGNQNDV